jgi:integrase
VERYGDLRTGKEKRVSITLEKNNRQAQKTARELLAKKIQDRQEAACKKQEDRTLEDLVADYRKAQLISVKKSTYTRNYFACDTLMKILGRDTLLSRLSAPYVRSAMLKTGKPAGTLNEHLTRYKALMRWGYENDLVDDISNLRKLKNFKDDPHRLKIQDKYLEGEELKAVLDGMDNEQWILVTKFMALSGLRFAEFCALERSDVDLNAKVISINKGYDSVNRELTTTKNIFSYREVHIQNYTHFMAETDGSYIHYYSFNKYLKTHAGRITGKHITPHALRHTHTSLLFEQGFTIDEIARRLGHGDSKITQEIYTHVTEKLIEKDNARLDLVKVL